MIRSLRLRLLISTSLATALILALLGFSVYGFMWHRLLSEFDSAQVTKARTIAAMVEMNGSTISFDADLDQMPEFSAKRNPEYFEIWLSDGKVLAKSPSLGAGDFSPRPGETNPEGEKVVLPDGHRGRAVSLLFTVHPEHEENQPANAAERKTATVLLAGRAAQIDHALDDLSWLLTFSCGAAVLLCGFVLYRIVGRAIAPVNRLALEIEALKETDLSHRLDSSSVPMELSPVVDKLNGLLGRLDDSFARERAFTADVAHELRTPLAGIQTTLEVSRSRSRDGASYELTIDECRAMTSRLQVMIENLLLLARADAGQLRVNLCSVNLREMMLECLEAFEARIAERRITLISGGDERNSEAISAAIDAEKVRIIIRNLLDNAVAYVNEGGTIRWSVSGSADWIEIVVSNTGCELSAGDVTKLFDRFWRGDPSRADTGVHCGLGLSICQRLTHVLGGGISVSCGGGEFVARVRLALTK
jgi:signal transduction histidine kinase